jgi:PAS domain S-box-containing protein
MVIDDVLLQLAPESIILMGAKGEVLAWNQASEQLYGWTSTEMLGSILSDRLEFTASDGMRPGEPSASSEFRGLVHRLAKDGEMRCVEVRRMPYGVRDGVPAGIVEFGKDVTGLQEVQRLLESATFRYESLFNAMPASFWELDFNEVRRLLKVWAASGIDDIQAHLGSSKAAVRELMRATKIVDFNDKSLDLFGRGDRDELFIDLNSYWPDESLPVFVGSVLAAMKRQPAYSAECVLSSLAGKRFEALFTVSMPPAQLERGQLLIGIVDISDVRQALADVEASEKRYRELFDATPAANMEIDCTTLENVFDEARSLGVADLHGAVDLPPGFFARALDACRVVSVNARFVKMMRTGSAEHACGTLARYWDRSPHIFRRFLEARFVGGEQYETQALLNRLDGTPLHCLVSTAFRPLASRPHIMLCTLVDVSDRVRAEEELATTRAELAHAGRVAVLGELAASIAHEVSQPLSSIALNSFAALHWLSKAEPDFDELRALATRSSEQAARATEVLLRIRNMARRVNPIREYVDVNRAVSDALLFVRDELMRNDLDAELKMAPELLPVMGDEIQLQQVVINLVLNAAQAMATMPWRRHRLAVSTHMRDGQICIFVDDTGPGIAVEDRERLFDSFYTTKEFGMGIGLPICLSIVVAHGGWIQPEEAPQGWATRFVVSFPPVGV